MLAVSSCETLHAPPKTETCITTTEGDGACDDPRLEEPKRSYFRDYKKGDMCTNPSDYQLLENYCSTLRQNLIKCERGKTALEDKLKALVH